MLGCLLWVVGRIEFRVHFRNLIFYLAYLGVLIPRCCFLHGETGAIGTL